MQKRYRVGSKVDGGTFSTVYLCHDLRDPSQKLVIKVSADIQMANREAKCLKYLESQDIHKGDRDVVPAIVAKGRFTLVEERPHQNRAATASDQAQPDLLC